MHLQRSQLLPHQDCLFHITFDEIKNHQLRVVTRFNEFPNDDDKAVGKMQVNDLRVLWPKAKEINEYPRLTRMINVKLFTLYYVFKCTFILSPIIES